MNPQQVRIVSDGPHSKDVVVYLDGKKVEGLRSVKWAAGVDLPVELVLSYACTEIDIDGEVGMVHHYCPAGGR